MTTPSESYPDKETERRKRRKEVLVRFRERHRDELREVSRKWTAEHPERRREQIAKYDASEKGRSTRERFQDRYRAVISERFIERYRSDSQFRAMHNSRQKAPRILRKAKHIPYRCVCGADEGLHAHHKDLTPLHNDLDNLMWLCHPCHASLHAQYERLPIERRPKLLLPRITIPFVQIVLAIEGEGDRI